MAKSKGKVIGIDLGTTNSVVAVMEGETPVVIPNAEGSRLTPSVVGFTDEGIIVGAAAKRQAVTNAQRTVYSIKRFMGRRHNEVAQEEKMVSYKIVGGGEEMVRVQIDSKEYTPPEISAMVLQSLKKTAEDYLGEKVTEAVITVPAYFNDSQRQATKDAGRIAGLDVKRLLNEPTAASLAYGLNKKTNERIAVYDLGGGTFDISILDVGDGVFQVEATNGDTHLGGDDIDEVLIGYVAEEFRKENNVDLRKQVDALQRLKEACERAKCDLSGASQAEINLPYITAVNNVPKHLTMKITRAKLESLMTSLIERTRAPVLQALKDAGLSPSDIAEVVLVGGSTRIPMAQELVRKLFGREPNKSVNPDEVVAVGAAIQAAILSGEDIGRDILLVDVTPLTLGVEVKGGLMAPLIERNTTIPTSKSEVFTTADDNQPAVTVKVYQGERKMADQNRLLGQFDLTGIPPAPRGMPQIEVSFNIDANGILNVSARDKGTNKQQSIRIESSSGLQEGDIKRMVKEAESNAADDEKRAETVKARNHAEQVVYETDKLLRDHGDKVSAEERSTLQREVDRLKEVLKGDDKAAMDAQIQAVMKASHKIAEAMYRASSDESTEKVSRAAKAAKAEPGVESEEAKPKSGVTDADFKVVDDNT